jgi:hypothetical protein
LLHQLAKLIGLDEALLGELANRARLPFAVSTEKGLHIAPGDLAAWLGARRRYIAKQGTERLAAAAGRLGGH